MSAVLVTGGAGFIGSHTVDALLAAGHRVRVFDNLEQPTHLDPTPRHVAPGAEFVRGDVRDRDALAAALEGMDAVIHLAATGGFTPDIVRYLEANTLGTAHLLEIIQEKALPIRKLVVASSVGIYGEGKYECRTCGVQTPSGRSPADMEAGRWEPRCPGCGRDLSPLPLDEQKLPLPSNAYCISKFDEERLVVGYGRAMGIPAIALRYFLTYGPRQSLTNPYTGVISIFSSRILNGVPPILFEDGNQLRDFVYVEDVARANVHALELPEPRWGVFNVGTGTPTRIADVATLLGELLGRPDLRPQRPGEFRDEARHMYADVSRFRAAGFEAGVTLRQGLERYLDWVRAQGDVAEYFTQALEGLRRSGVVRGRRHEGTEARRHEGSEEETQCR